MGEEGVSGLVYEGLLRAKIEFLNEHAGSSIAGVALCTDDELGTLYCMMVTQEELEEGDDPDLLFNPVDWPCREDLELFAKANERLREGLAESDDLLPHVDESFDALVVAMELFRRADAVPRAAYLSVLSTDPNDYLLELEGRSVKRLNDKAVVIARNDFLKRWE
jgi:hypothetical protein